MEDLFEVTFWRTTGGIDVKGRHATSRIQVCNLCLAFFFLYSAIPYFVHNGMRAKYGSYGCDTPRFVAYVCCD